MDERKSFIMDLAETIDRHWPRRTEREGEPAARPGWLRWLSRHIVPNIGTLLLVAVLILTQQVWAEPLLGTANVPGPSANTVNYQGRLADDAGTPLDGSYGMSFALYDAPTNGNLVWGPEAHDAVPVTDGLFSVGLGSVTPIPTSTWNGDVYLEVTVGGETLEPRELIRSVPIAGMALTVQDGAIGTSQLAPGSVTNSQTVVVGPGAGAIETTSTAFTDMPGYEITMETTGGPVLLIFQAAIAVDATNGRAMLDFTVDDNRVSGGALKGINQVVNSASGWVEPGTTFWVVTPPAGTHTFRVQWKSDGGTAVRLNQQQYAAQFAAVELMR